MNKRLSFGLFSGLFMTAAALVAALLLIPNSLTDRFVSREVSRLADHRVILEGVRIRFTRQALILSIEKADLGTAPQGTFSDIERFFKDFQRDGRMILEDSRWMLMPKRGGLSVRVLSGRIGGASIRGGFFLKDGKTQKLLTRIRVRTDSLPPFSRLIDERFPQSRDGHRVAKLSSSGGRWVLWGRQGPVLEARWQ